MLDTPRNKLKIIVAKYEKIGLDTPQYQERQIRQRLTKEYFVRLATSQVDRILKNPF